MSNAQLVVAILARRHFLRAERLSALALPAGTEALAATHAGMPAASSDADDNSREPRETQD